jgi:hypothetical protein
MADVAFKDEGNEAFKANHFVQAIAAYSKAIDLNPSVPAYFTNRAFAYLKTEGFILLIKLACF